MRQRGVAYRARPFSLGPCRYVYAAVSGSMGSMITMATSGARKRTNIDNFLCHEVQ
jgi:hypothetical protein